jgi:DNA polymerase III subunit epsilon
MLPGEYIFIDTETTGCRPTIDRITEIGLYYVIDGIVQFSWQKLINPEIAIPLRIQSLTGITDEMVANEPVFADIAVELADIIHGKIFVAHNARFDYAFIKNEMKRCGITLTEKTLCSVKLSRMLFPNAVSHSLDAIASRFQLQVDGRHRAMADATLLLEFFQILQQQMSAEKLHAVIKSAIKLPSLPSELPITCIDDVPNIAGVYRFYGKDDALLYIGKSVRLRERILSHFTQDHSHDKELRLAQQTKRIEWTPTTGELGALLLESKLIKQQIPIFNRKLRRHKELFTLHCVTDKDGYHHLNVAAFNDIPAHQLPNTYGFFRRKSAAVDMLQYLVKEHHLCPKLTSLEKRTKGTCFYYQLKRCSGACGGIELALDYNARLLANLSNLQYKAWPYAGTIAIKETCRMTKKHEYHFVDQWCYLGSANNLDNWQQELSNPDQLQLDVDIYQILTNFMEKKRRGIAIVPIK